MLIKKNLYFNFIFSFIIIKFNVRKWHVIFEERFILVDLMWLHREVIIFILGFKIYT